MAGRAAAGALLWVGFASACSGPGPAAVRCDMVQSSIVNGTPQESYLGLSPAQIQAIVQVVDTSTWSAGASLPAGGLCSGAFIAPDWVVTAGHCTSIQAPGVVVQDANAQFSQVLPVTTTVANADVDLALLRVDLAVGDAGSGGVEPFAAGGPSIASLALGTVVEMAGYGVNEAGRVGELRFLDEPIVATDATTITVDGFGANGACDGDSGGPLLVRRPDGTPTVAGVLSFGSSTCVEQDVYTRLDAVQAWIETTTGSSSSAPEADRGTLSLQGRCLYGSALWCASGKLASAACQPPEECGWDPTQQGFRCVLSQADPCKGIDSVGACLAGSAARCALGALTIQACDPCETCRVNGQTGAPECSVAEPDD